MVSQENATKSNCNVKAVGGDNKSLLLMKLLAFIKNDEYINRKNRDGSNIFVEALVSVSNNLLREKLDHRYHYYKVVCSSPDG